jgi:hypothetical protein
MSQPPLDPAPLARALDRARLSVLVVLAGCAGVAATQTANETAAVDPRITLGALALAFGSIVARHLSRSRTRPPQSAVYCALTGLAMAAAVGAVGVFAAASLGARETGILLAFGGFILAIPRPQIAALREPPSP